MRLILLSVILVGSLALTVSAEQHLWKSLGTGLNGPVDAMVVYQGSLVVGGEFTTAGGAPALHIARWDGSSWHAIGEFPDIGTGAVTALGEYNGHLIAGSFVQTTSSYTGYVRMWDGSQWVVLAEWGERKILDFCTWDGKLVAAVQTYGGATLPSRIADVWDGTQWSGLGTPNGYYSEDVLEFNGDLYAAGNYYFADWPIKQPAVVRWNGSVWEPVGTVDWPGKTLTIFNDELYLGSWTRVHVLHGSDWETIYPAPNSGTGVQTIGVYEGKLLTCIGQLLRYDSGAWRPIDRSHVNTSKFLVYDGNLVVSAPEVLGPDTVNYIAYKVSLDTDGDGVDDYLDNCVFTPHASQSNIDHDTLGDPCDDCYACDDHVYLDHIEGLWGTDSLQTGVPIKFHFGIATPLSGVTYAASLSWRVSSPEGALWQSARLDTVPFGWSASNHPKWVSFRCDSIPGPEADTFHFSAGNTETGWAAGARGDAIIFEVQYDKAESRKTICLDSVQRWDTYSPPGYYFNGWYMGDWRTTAFWTGPYNYTLYNCCQKARGDINASGVTDLADLSLLISYLLAGGTTSHFCLLAADVNAAGVIDLSDLSVLISYLVSGGALPPPCS